MGQSSLPVLNKSGRTVRWTNTWDDKHFYNIKFEEDIFIKIFFELFFRENLSNQQFLFSKNYLFKLNNFYYFQYYTEIENMNTFRELVLSSFELHRVIFYFLRFHILRIKNIIVVFIKLFFPEKRKISEQQKMFFNKYTQKFVKIMRIFTLTPKIKQNIFSLKNF